MNESSSLFAHRCLNHDVLGTKSIPPGVIRMSIVTEREAVLGMFIVVFIRKAGMFKRYSPGGIGALNLQPPRLPDVVMGVDLNDPFDPTRLTSKPSSRSRLTPPPVLTMLNDTALGASLSCSSFCIA